MAQTSGTTMDKISEKLQDIASGEPREGKMTRRLEQQTAKIPSGGFLGLAIGSMLISAGIALFSRKRDLANFVGLWAPSLLLIGLYNKLVKLQGSD